MDHWVLHDWASWVNHVFLLIPSYSLVEAFILKLPPNSLPLLQPLNIPSPSSHLDTLQRPTSFHLHPENPTRKDLGFFHLYEYLSSIEFVKRKRSWMCHLFAQKSSLTAFADVWKTWHSIQSAFWILHNQHFLPSPTPHHCLFLSYSVLAYSIVHLHYSVPCHPRHLQDSGPLFIFSLL